MVRNPWLLAPVTAQHAALAQTMVGNMHNSYTLILQNLTPEDKQGCLKVGNPQVAMIEQTLKVCRQHPRVMPAFHTVADFEQGVESIKNLEAIRGELMSILEAVEGTLTGVKSDTMQIALDYYKGMKIAVKSAMPGLRKQYMEIRDNFIHTTGQSPEEQFPDADTNGPEPTVTA